MSLLDGTADEATDPKLRTTVQFTVRKTEYTGDAIFSPDLRSRASTFPRASRSSGRPASSASSSARTSWSTYTGTALVPKTGEDGFTANKLRAAGQDYSAEVRSLYLTTGPGVFGTGSTRLVTEIKARAMADCITRNAQQKDAQGFCAQNAYDPWDLAVATKDILRWNEFTYKTDVTGLACQNISAVECFAEFKQGYCQYYASTMACSCARSASRPGWPRAGCPAAAIRGRASRRSC